MSQDYAQGSARWWLRVKHGKWTRNVHQRFRSSPVAAMSPTISARPPSLTILLRCREPSTVISDAYVGGSCKQGLEMGLVDSNSPIAVVQARPYP